MRAHVASRRALAALARLTITLGAAGCTGNVVVDKAPADLDEGEATPNEPPDVAVDPPAEACFEPATDTEVCCNTLLLDAFYGEGNLLADPTLATEEHKACCDLAVAAMDEWFAAAAGDEPPFDLNVPTGCCSSGLVEGGWDVHPSCTPWGPPMPPAMPRAFDLRDLEVLA
jgi:hypothetical protein